MSDTSPSILRNVFQALEAYLGVTVVRKNQSGPKPIYPYIGYGVLVRNKDRANLRYDVPNADPTKATSLYVIPEGATISLSFYNAESTLPLDPIYDLAVKAREWFEIIGKDDLEAIGVVCDDFGANQEKSALLNDTTYEYQCGFDFRIRGAREIELTVDVFDLDATAAGITGEVL